MQTRQTDKAAFYRQFLSPQKNDYGIREKANKILKINQINKTERKPLGYNREF
jgi:hypothetical protein